MARPIYFDIETNAEYEVVWSCGQHREERCLDLSSILSISRRTCAKPEARCFPDHSIHACCLRIMRSPQERHTARGARGNRVVIASAASGHRTAIRPFPSISRRRLWQLCPPTGCHRTHLIDTLHDVDAAKGWTLIKPHVARPARGLPVLASEWAGAPNDGQPQWRFYRHE